MTYTPIPAQPTNGQNPWYATMAAWMDGVETAIGEVDAHSVVATVHVPSGGTVGQVLKKNSGTTGDYAWADPPATGVSDHGALSGLSDPDHPIAAVIGLQAGLDAKAALAHTHTGVYDTSGTAAAAVSTHAGLADPHPGYLTPAEGSAAFAPIAAAPPTGGATGFVLTKTGTGDYAWQWAAPGGGGGISPPYEVVGTDPASVPFGIKAAAGQTATTWQVRANDSTNWIAVENDGDIRVGLNVANQVGLLKVGGTDAAKPVVLLRMAGSQTAKAISVLDSTPTEKFSVAADGTVVGANIGGILKTAVILDATATIPTGLPAGTLVMRRPA